MATVQHLAACPWAKAPLPLSAHEALPLLRHRRRPDAGEPRVRLPARHPDRCHRSAAAPSPTPSSSPSAFPTCSAACSARARSTRPSCRCSPSGSRAKGAKAARAFAEEALAGLVFILAGAHHRRRDRHAVPDVRPGAGLQPTTPEKFDLAVLLTRITMPYLLCMSLVALLSGVLNSFGKFVESSSVSIVLNLVHDGGDAASASWLGYQQRADGRRHPGVGRVRRRHPAAARC